MKINKKREQALFDVPSTRVQKPKFKILSESQATQYMTNNPIVCEKYNYSFEECVQNFNHYECKIQLQGKTLMIYNWKTNLMGNEGYIKSGASCDINEI